MTASFRFRPTIRVATMLAIGGLVAALVMRPPPLDEGAYAVIEGLTGVLTPMIASVFGAMAARAHHGRTRWAGSFA